MEWCCFHNAGTYYLHKICNGWMLRLHFPPFVCWHRTLETENSAKLLAHIWQNAMDTFQKFGVISIDKHCRQHKLEINAFWNVRLCLVHIAFGSAITRMTPSNGECRTAVYDHTKCVSDYFLLRQRGWNIQHEINIRWTFVVGLSRINLHNITAWL